MAKIIIQNAEELHTIARQLAQAGITLDTRQLPDNSYRIYLIAALTALGAAMGLNSCNVVRTITNKSEFYQRGDTSVMIQTKTTESYDASKKFY